MNKMADEIPTFESMFRKSKGLDLAEEAPSEEESTPAEIQRSRVSDKLTDEDGNSRLKHKANVPALENYDQDIRAPQGEVHDADKLKATRKSAGIREMIARECFEKTGRIPDVDFMDTYEVKKAANEADFNEMAEGFADSNRKMEVDDTVDHLKNKLESRDIILPEHRRNFVRDKYLLEEYGTPSRADIDKEYEYEDKTLKPYRSRLSDVANEMAPKLAARPAKAYRGGEDARRSMGPMSDEEELRILNANSGDDFFTDGGNLKTAMRELLKNKYGLSLELAEDISEEFSIGINRS
jgi:hypothetical protein